MRSLRRLPISPVLVCLLLIVPTMIVYSQNGTSDTRTFYGNAGEHAQITVQSGNSLIVELYAPDDPETPIAGNDDSDGDGVVELDLELPITGAYTIEIYSSDMETPGDYEISILINGEELPPPNNCIVRIDGQGWHASGGSGGVSNVPGDVAEFGAVADVILQSAPNIGSDPVAILVVDDFSAGTAPDDALNMLLTGTPVESLDIIHGEMVYAHINSLLEAAGLNQIFSDDDHTDWEANGVPLVTVVKVRVTNYNTVAVSDEIGTHVRLLEDNSPLSQPIFRFVVNMSFSILPCDTANPYQEFTQGTPGASLRDFYEQTIDSNGDLVAFRQWLMGQLALVQSDPLLNLSIDFTDGDQGDFFTENSVLIASAGNEPELDFPLYPGAWDTVIGVSAYEGDPNTRTIWNGSSIGDAILSGAWYQFRGEEFYYAGTSFAAPVMSIIAALRLTNAANECPFDQVPPLMAASAYPDVASIPPIDKLLVDAGC